MSAKELTSSTDALAQGRGKPLCAHNVPTVTDKNKFRGTKFSLEGVREVSLITLRNSGVLGTLPGSVELSGAEF